MWIFDIWYRKSRDITVVFENASFSVWSLQYSKLNENDMFKYKNKQNKAKWYENNKVKIEMLLFIGTDFLFVQAFFMSLFVCSAETDNCSSATAYKVENDSS